MWLVVGVKSICDEESFKHKNQKRIKLFELNWTLPNVLVEILNWTNQKKKKRIKLLNCFLKDKKTKKAETNKVGGRFEPGDESS